MGGYKLGSAFDLKSGRAIMVGLLLMVGSFYLGTLFGGNAPIYVSRTFPNSSSSGISSFLAHSVSQITYTHFHLDVNFLPFFKFELDFEIWGSGKVCVFEFLVKLTNALFFLNYFLLFLFQLIVCKRACHAVFVIGLQMQFA